MSRTLILAVSVVALCFAASPSGAEAPGFPVPLGGDGYSSPVVADFNGDGALEIAVAVDNVAAKDQPARGAILMVDREGASLPGWPMEFPVSLFTTQPVVGKLLPDDPGTQLALGTSDNRLHLLTAPGAEAPGFPVDVGAYCGRCFIADLGEDGKPELIGVAASGRVCVLDSAGKPQPGWPQTVEGGLAGDCEVADWDGDGTEEVLVLDKAGALHVLSAGSDTLLRPSSGTGATGFCTGDFLADSPGLELLLTNGPAGTATLLDHGGDPLPGWPVEIAHPALPTAVRLTRDGPPCALVVGQAQGEPERTTNTIHLLGPGGKELPGWPAAPQFVPGYQLWSRPAVADVDGDGAAELFFGHTCYAVVGLRADGSRLQGFPLQNVGMAYTTPVLANLTSDRRYDLIFADVSSVRSLHAFPLPYDSAAWQAHRPTPAETARGFVLTSAIPFETILPDAPMVEGKLLERLEITACAGEYEPATFLVHALRDLDVILRPADLVEGAGALIPSSNLDLRFVHVWRQRRPDNPGEYLVPELLLKRDPGEMKGVISQPLTAEVTTRIPAGTTRQFWVTVRVPDAAAPGTYAGSLTLSTGEASVSVPFSVRVLPLNLPPDPFTHAIYFHGSSVGLGWYGEKAMPADAWLQRARLQVADLRAHGLNAAGTFTPVKITTRGDGYDFDLSNLSQTLALHQEAGLKRWVMLELGYSLLDGEQLHPRLGDRFYAAYAALVKAVGELNQRGPNLPLSFYGVDEPARSSPEAALKYYGFEDPIEVCRRWFEAIRAGGGYSTSAVYHTAEGGWETLGPLCDLPIYSLGSIFPSLKRDDLTREVAANRTHEAWYYWQCWTENPIQNRLLAGLFLCKSGLSGVAPWDYMGYDGDPFDDFDGPGKDMCIAYPSQEGPIPTLSWEAYREGVDDCRYWEAVKGSPAAQELLDRLSWSDSHNCVSLTAEDLQGMRRELSELAR